MNVRPETEQAIAALERLIMDVKAGLEPHTVSGENDLDGDWMPLQFVAVIGWSRVSDGMSMLTMAHTPNSPQWHITGMLHAALEDLWDETSLDEDA